MTAASKHHQGYHQSSTSKPPKTPAPTFTTATTTTTTTQINNNSANPNPLSSAKTTTTTPPIRPSAQDQFLSRATHLTRLELLKRRSHNLKQLSRCYRDHYWALMEELKIQYREYYWKFGSSPFKEDQQRDDPGLGEGETGEGNSNHNIEVIGENNNCGGGGNVNGSLDLKSNHRCLFVGCKLKAMALTSFCHLHILSDSKQKLYKPCGYVIKSAQAGPITCGKPILRSTAPSLCSVHFQKAQKHVTRALKKAGLNVSSSSKIAPKFHVIVAEYVRQIQTKRRAAAKMATKSKDMDKEETAT